MKQIFFYFDQTRCNGCAACIVACKDWNNVPAGSEIQWRRVYSFEAGSFPNVDVLHFCLSCFHCAEPACAKACPVGAIYIEEGSNIVLVDRSMCIGGRQCLIACPYGAPQFAPGDYKVWKCTFCIGRQKKGLKPACVDACMYLALDSGTKGELTARYGPLTPLKANLVHGVDEEHEATKPSLLIKTRSMRVKNETPLVMRKNGVVVNHLRAVPGPPKEVWQERSRTPFVRKCFKKC